MPEGDTVRKVADALRPRLAGRVIENARLLRMPHVDLARREVTAVFSKGKHLFIELGELLLRSHLGMYGSWHRYRPGERWRKPERLASIVLTTAEEVFVCFRAREVECLPAAGIRPANVLLRLGPDLADEEVDLEQIVKRTREFCEPDSPIADVLLDQRTASGIGNVFKCEVLFLGGVEPARSLADVDDATLRDLFGRAHDLIRRNLGAGPRTTRFANDGRGRLWVYGRGGQTCFRCETAVRSARLGRNLRDTHWCPRCQR